MTELNNFTATSQALHSSKEETFLYDGKKVKIITVFNDAKESTALVEDETGEIFQVPKNSLR